MYRFFLKQETDFTVFNYGTGKLFRIPVKVKLIVKNRKKKKTNNKM